MSINNYFQLLEKINIVEVIKKYLNLTKKGNNYFAICPFHNDHKPSLIVSENKQIFKCFSCEIGGNAIKFITLYEKISYQSAIQKLATTFNLVLTNKFDQNDNHYQIFEPWLKINQDFQTFCFLNLADKWSNDKHVVKKYLISRKFLKQTIEKFGLGWIGDEDECQKLWNFLKEKNHKESDLINIGLFNRTKNKINCYFKNRLIFPIWDENKKIIGFSSRICSTNSNESKYLNNKETELFKKQSLLYNLHNVLENFPYYKHVYLVEGFFDVMRISEQNYPAIGLMGTNLSENHVEKLKNFYSKIIIIPDNDFPGIKSAITSCLKLLEHQFDVKVVFYDNFNDPDSWLLNDYKTWTNKPLLEPLEFLKQQITPQKINNSSSREWIINSLKKLLRYVGSQTRQKTLAWLDSEYQINFEEFEKQISIKTIYKNGIKEKDWKIVIFIQMLKYPEILKQFTNKNQVIFNGEKYPLDFWFSQLIKWYNLENDKQNLTFKDFKNQFHQKSFWSEIESFFNIYRTRLEIDNLDIDYEFYKSKFKQEKINNTIKKIKIEMNSEKNLEKQITLFEKISELRVTLNNLKMKLK